MKYLSLIAFFLGALSLTAQDDGEPPVRIPQCDCIEMLTDRFNAVDAAQNPILDEHLQEVFDNLREESPQFRQCSDYWSISNSLWTRRVLTGFVEADICNISEKAARFLTEDGPIFFDLNANAESRLRDRLEGDDWQTIDVADHPKLLASVEAQAKRNARAMVEGDAGTYIEGLPEEVVDFFTIETLDFMVVQGKVEFDEMGVVVNTYDFSVADKAVKRGDDLQTVIDVTLGTTIDGEEFPIPLKLIALSRNKGEHWMFLNAATNDARTSATIIPWMNPFAIELMEEEMFMADYPAETAEEIVDHFCPCMNELADDDLAGLMHCSQIIAFHPMWQSDDQAIYDVVKEKCPDHTGLMLFMGME